MFELELKKRLMKNIFLVSGITEYKENPSIFAYYIPDDAKKPYIKFFTSDYRIPLKKETKLLTIEYMNDEMITEDIEHYGNEIINIFDNTIIKNEEFGDLRLFLFGKPVLTNKEFNGFKISVDFIIRGPIKYWGII